MSNINCDVIKDLLPLYTDQVLSKSSRELVEEHLKGCKDCSEFLSRMKENPEYLNVETSLKDKNVIRNVRKKLTRKKIITICVTFVAAVAVFIALFYVFVVNRFYLPFEKSGLTMENDLVTAIDTPHMMWAFGNEELRIEFIYMESNLYERIFERHTVTEPLRIRDEIFNYEDFDSSNGENYRIHEIYYLSKENAEKLSSGEYLLGSMTSEELEQLKSESTLIWKFDDVQ